MDESGEARTPVERVLDLEQALRDALARRDGEAARRLATEHGRALRLAAENMPPGDETWMREACDRLADLIRQAEGARDAIGVEIGDIGMRRKLMGRDGSLAGARPRRSFLA